MTSHSMALQVTADLTTAEAVKQQLLETVAADIGRAGLTIVDRDPARPWGAFFVIDEQQIAAFT